MIATVAREQLAGRLRIEPHVVAYAGEVLTSDMRTCIVDAWGVEPMSLYSTTEAGLIASGPATGMQLWEDLALVEVVDANHRPVPPGVPGHHILLTNLTNRTQPLIRYEITDLVTLVDGPGPFRRIGPVDGRSDDVAHLPGIGGGTVPVPPHVLRTAVGGAPGLQQYQVVVTPSAVRVAVVLDGAGAALTPPRIRATLHRVLRSAGVDPPPITVTPVAAIARERGHAAKLKTVVVEPARLSPSGDEDVVADAAPYD